MTVDLEAYRTLEVAEYMAKARPSFTKDALCRGSIYPEIEQAFERAERRGIQEILDISTTFFPSRGGSSKVAAAKKICAECPVQWECFEYAYDGKEQAGIWGGSSVEERENSYKNELTAERAFVELFGLSKLRQLKRHRG